MSTEARDALDRAIAVMKGQSKLARELAARTGKPIRQGHVWAWRNRFNKVPPEMAPYIEAATADAGEKISRHALCPGFPWEPVNSSSDSEG